MSKKYSKNEIKKRGFLKLLLCILVILFIASAFVIFTVVIKNYIVIEKIDYSSKNKSDNVVKNATPIILNNVVIGATYDKEWVATESYYFRNDKKSIDVDVDVYTEAGKKGKYQMSSCYKSQTGSTVYATVTTPDRSSEFIAVASSDSNIMPKPANREISVDEIDIKEAKEALGILTLLNNSVRIASIHDVTFNASNRGRIFCLTNEAGKSSGGYSAVIYISNTGKVDIIKYSYVNNLKKSSDWPIYEFKFVADLNGDSMNELVIQEINEYEVKYDVIEFKNNKFTQVLSTTMNL